tara:strand:+ start:42 stop:275 length:234 start_codon:yes stop_codon:yes gene_type:complete
MTNLRIQTNLHFDCNEKAEEERLHLARHLFDCDMNDSWFISVRTLYLDIPSIVLTYPITEAESVAKALTLWEETKDD